jgi:NAD-dependent dihydropyrimidine dehydrogenase PreA subunit
MPSEIDANCKPDPGVFAPVIDRSRCEGKAQCVTVCPYHVFVVDVLPKEQRAGLSLKGKVKGFAHGWRQAFTPNADACHACGLCVAACPEQAITLARV